LTFEFQIYKQKIMSLSFANRRCKRINGFICNMKTVLNKQNTNKYIANAVNIFSKSVCLILIAKTLFELTVHISGWFQGVQALATCGFVLTILGTSMTCVQLFCSDSPRLDRANPWILLGAGET